MEKWAAGIINDCEDELDGACVVALVVTSELEQIVKNPELFWKKV